MCLNEGDKKLAEAHCCSSEGPHSGIDVRDTPWVQVVQKNEWWAAGAGCAIRCERPAGTCFSFRVQRVHAPD
eukprot:4211895-Prymnesium_polylepis.1